MKNKDFKNLLKSEINDLDIPMSEKILSVPLQKKNFETLPQKEYKNLTGLNFFKFFIPTLCSCGLVIIILLSAIFSFYDIKDIKTTKASNLTSYIIEINPAICITADSENKVISVCSLNNDGDIILCDEFFSEIPNQTVLLNDCIDKIMDLTFSNGNFEINQNIRLFAINNREKFAREKGTFVKDHIIEKLINSNFENIDVEFKFMNVEKFSGRMNLEGDYNDLDEFQEEIQGRQRYFDPRFLDL